MAEFTDRSNDLIETCQGILLPSDDHSLQISALTEQEVREMHEVVVESAVSGDKLAEFIYSRTKLLRPVEFQWALPVASELLAALFKEDPLLKAVRPAKRRSDFEGLIREKIKEVFSDDVLATLEGCSRVLPSGKKMSDTALDRAWYGGLTAYFLVAFSASLLEDWLKFHNLHPGEGKKREILRYEMDAVSEGRDPYLLISNPIIRKIIAIEYFLGPIFDECDATMDERAKTVARYIDRGLIDENNAEAICSNVRNRLLGTKAPEVLTVGEETRPESAGVSFHAENAFRAILRDRLTEKYGQPSTEKQKRDRAQSVEFLRTIGRNRAWDRDHIITIIDRFDGAESEMIKWFKEEALRRTNAAMEKAVKREATSVEAQETVMTMQTTEFAAWREPEIAGREDLGNWLSRLEVITPREYNFMKNLLAGNKIYEISGEARPQMFPELGIILEHILLYRLRRRGFRFKCPGSAGLQARAAIKFSFEFYRFYRQWHLPQPVGCLSAFSCYCAKGFGEASSAFIISDRHSRSCFHTAGKS